MWTHLIEMARPIVEAMVPEVTGVKVVSLHHDISCEGRSRITLNRCHLSSITRRQTFAMFRAAEPFWAGVSRRISSMSKSE